MSSPSLECVVIEFDGEEGNKLSVRPANRILYNHE